MFTQVRKQNVSICLQERGPNSPGSLSDAITPLMPLQCHHNLHHTSTEASQSSGCLCSDLGKVREHRSHWRAEHDTRVTATVTAGRKAGAEHRTWPQLGQTAGTFLPPAPTQGCSGMLNTKAGKKPQASTPLGQTQPVGSPHSAQTCLALPFVPVQFGPLIS